MSTTAVQSTTATTDKSKTPRQRRTFSVRLEDATGSAMRVVASLRKEGAISYAEHLVKDGKKTTRTRGATEHHATIAAAREAAEKLVAAALRLGWTKRAAGAFTRKPDAFDAAHLPAPRAKR